MGQCIPSSPLRLLRRPAVRFDAPCAARTHPQIASHRWQLGSAGTQKKRDARGRQDRPSHQPWPARDRLPAARDRGGLPVHRTGLVRAGRSGLDAYRHQCTDEPRRRGRRVVCRHRAVLLRLPRLPVPARPGVRGLAAVQAQRPCRDRRRDHRVPYRRLSGHGRHRLRTGRPAPAARSPARQCRRHRRRSVRARADQRLRTRWRHAVPGRAVPRRRDAGLGAVVAVAGRSDRQVDLGCRGAVRPGRQLGCRAHRSAPGRSRRR